MISPLPPPPSPPSLKASSLVSLTHTIVLVKLLMLATCLQLTMGPLTAVVMVIVSQNQ